MCGIVGTLVLDGCRAAREEPLRAMLGALRHRGPDQFGLLLDGPAGMGNARLSILDLSTGQQPIANEDKTLWIVFNGEIFNHAELRRDLEARGHRFRTTCDTEVVLHLFEEEGPDCLSSLNGQFAIAIWDTRSRTLFLGRDRLGVRPLFHTLVGGTFVFGSEIKALLTFPGIRAALDPAALDQAFTYWAPLAPATAFEGIQELPPAHYLLVREGRMSLHRYWDVDFPDEPLRLPNLEAYVEAFRELLVDATRLRLRADVPVGAYLSGGLDSSTIASIIRHHTDTPLETFSIAFSNPAYDEGAYQERMARHLGTRHHVVSATEADIGRAFPEVVWHTEAPLLRTSPAPMFLLSRLVREHRFKVVLTGEGADEVLAGYDLFKEAKIRRFWAQVPQSKVRPGFFRKIYPWIPDLAAGGTAFLAAFFGQGLEATEALDYSHRPRWRTTQRCRRFFSRDLIERAEAHPHPGPRLPAAMEGMDPLHQAQFLEMTTFLSPYLLSSQSDRVAMAHSVEGRFPFLDHRVVAFCSRLPPTLKLRGLTEKFLLKETARAWLPADICDRPKQPFRAPIHRCFFPDGHPLDAVEACLAPESLVRAGVFNPSSVAALLAKLKRGGTLGETDDMALVGIVSTQLLAHQFVDHFEPPAPIGGGEDLKRVILDPASPGALS
jgi:asparagine synthase (glutamine-hydrolysing)